MENNGEDVISDVLAKARAEEAERQKKNPDSVVNFRASLNNDNIRHAFDTMFNPDGSLTDDGKVVCTKFGKLLPSFTFDGTKSYFIKGANQQDLYKFLCFYIKAEWKYRVLKRQVELKKRKEDYSFNKAARDVYNLSPVVVFSSPFVDYMTNTDSDKDLLGDSYSKILVIYNPNVSLFGNQLPYYASRIKNYVRFKNSHREHVIVLSEVNLPEFVNDGSLTLVDWGTGGTTKSHVDSYDAERTD